MARINRPGNPPSAPEDWSEGRLLGSGRLRTSLHGLCASSNGIWTSLGRFELNWSRTLVKIKEGNRVCQHIKYLNSWIFHHLFSLYKCILSLTLSTCSNTRRKLCRRTPASSFSVQFLLSSSWIRAGYFETSSNPWGKLLTKMKTKLLSNYYF